MNLESSINEINYNGHAKNTAGGLCILDANGKISASGFIQNNVEYDLSGFLPKTLMSAQYPTRYILRVNNPTNGSWSFTIGEGYWSNYGTTNIFGATANINGSTVNIGATTSSTVTHGGANPNTAGGFCILDANGSLSIPGNITTAGKQNITLSSLSGIIPSEGKVMKFTLAQAVEISFDSTSLTANNTVDFELQLIQPSTAVTVTFPQGIIWGEDGHFSSSNLAPDLTTGNTLYDFSIRWNGTRFLINLAYTEEIGQ